MRRTNEADTVTGKQEGLNLEDPFVGVLDLGLSIAGCSINREDLWVDDTIILKSVLGEGEIALKVTYIGPVRDSTRWEK